MVAGAWICLLAPLGGALAITLAGPWISRRTAGWISTLTTFLAFVMLLYDDPGEGEGRFWERVLETGLGIAAAAVFGLMLPALLDRSERPDAAA